MKLIKFTGSDGKLIAAVNPEHIISAVPSRDGYLTIHTHAGAYEVPEEQMEKITEHTDDELTRINASIGRLITALDRLTVHIPSSIRMHL